MRLSGTKATAVHQYRGLGNQLWDLAGNRPSLDLPFAETKSLVDATTGTNLIDFTRASSGTYVGSDGLIKTATTNLLLRSEEFGDASWTKQSSVSVSANTDIAPNGMQTADTVTADQSLGVFQNATSVVGLNYVNSVYIKAGTATSMMLRDDTGAGRHIVFNPSTGAITSTSGTLVSSGSQAVGNGWYRYWMVYAADATTVRGIIRPNSSGSAQTFFVWGAQLEQSSTVGEYIPTTSTINSAPRFDHNPTTGESLGLLVEEARTNLSLRSQEFDTAAWTKTASSIAVDAIAAPNGTTTADKLVEDSSTGGHSILEAAAITYTTGTAYTFSFFIKKAERQTAHILMHPNPFPGTVAQRTAIFNSNTGAFVSVGSAFTSSSVTAFANGWYRVSVASTADATSTGNFTISLCSDDVGTTSYTGNGTSGLFLWGAQLEAGAFPTSYIPTTTTTVTRAADVASISGSNFSSWYRQDEGTVFAETWLPAGTAVNTSSRSVTDATDGSTNNRVNLRAIASATSQDQLTIRSGAVTVAQFSSSGTNVSAAARKIAAVYKLDDYASWATGATSAATDASGAIPVGVNQITVGSAVGGSEFMSGTIRRLTYWPARLSDSTLQQITQ